MRWEWGREVQQVAVPGTSAGGAGYEAFIIWWAQAYNLLPKRGVLLGFCVPQRGHPLPTCSQGLHQQVVLEAGCPELAKLGISTG